jgi:hypothetical protein
VITHNRQFVRLTTLIAIVLTGVASQAAFAQMSRQDNQQDQTQLLQQQQCVASPGEKKYTIRVKAPDNSHDEIQKRLVAIGCAPAYFAVGYPDKPFGITFLLTPIANDLVHLDMQIAAQPNSEPQVSSKLLSVKEGDTASFMLNGYAVYVQREFSPKPNDFDYTVNASVKMPSGALFREAQPLVLSVGGKAGTHGTATTSSVRDGQYPACLPNNGLQATPLPTGWRVTADQEESGNVTFHIWSAVPTNVQPGQRGCYDIPPTAVDTTTIGPVSLDHGKSVSAVLSNGYVLSVTRS